MLGAATTLGFDHVALRPVHSLGCCTSLGAMCMSHGTDVKSEKESSWGTHAY